jgi:hypothetical protein
VSGMWRINLWPSLDPSDAGRISRATRLSSHTPSKPSGHTHNPSRMRRDRGHFARWRARTTQVALARRLTPHGRRALANALRDTVKHATHRTRTPRALALGPGARWCWTPLLPYRTAGVRSALLEIAALLEQARDPDPACIQEIHQLLTDGNSPLYHPSVHISELYATLYYLRAGLLRERAAGPAGRQSNDRASHPDGYDAVREEKKER